MSGPPIFLLREEPREEALHARAERVGALLDAPVLEVPPGALGRRLRRLARLLELVAAELRALDDGVADALGGLLDAGAELAVTDLLRAGLDLAGGRFDLRFVSGRRRRRRPADQGRQRDRDGQQSLGGHGGLPPRVLTPLRVPRGGRRRRVRRLSPGGRVGPSTIAPADGRPG